VEKENSRRESVFVSEPPSVSRCAPRSRSPVSPSLIVLPTKIPCSLALGDPRRPLMLIGPVTCPSPTSPTPRCVDVVGGLSVLFSIWA